LFLSRLVFELANVSQWARRNDVGGEASSGSQAAIGSSRQAKGTTAPDLRLEAEISHSPIAACFCQGCSTCNHMKQFLPGYGRESQHVMSDCGLASLRRAFLLSATSLLLVPPNLSRPSLFPFHDGPFHYLISSASELFLTNFTPSFLAHSRHTPLRSLQQPLSWRVFREALTHACLSKSFLAPRLYQPLRPYAIFLRIANQIRNKTRATRRTTSECPSAVVSGALAPPTTTISPLASADLVQVTTTTTLQVSTTLCLRLLDFFTRDCFDAPCDIVTAFSTNRV